MPRQGWLLVTILTLVGGIAVWLFLLEPIQRHGKFSSNVRADLESLAKNRPPNVSRKQWENIVGWSLNAHANCFGYWHELSRDEMNRFQAELKQRLARPVTLETIDWIWDEFVPLSHVAQWYSDQYRPTRPERLKEFEEGGTSWGIEVD